MKTKLLAGTATLSLVHPAPGAVGDSAIVAASPRVSATVQGVVENTGLSRTVVFRLLATGQLRAVKAGSRTLILWQTVVDYLASLSVAKFGART